MGTVELEFDDKDIRKFLESITKKTNELNQHTGSIVGILSSIVFRDTMSHFESEEGPEGKWKEWSVSYRRAMQRIGKGENKILQDTGRLRQSFLPKNVRSVDEGLLWFNPARTKSGFPYAYAHDTGGPKLPQRSFMWASDKSVEIMSKAILDHLLSEK